MRQHFVLKEACPRENLEEESNLLVFYQSLLDLEEKKYPTLASDSHPVPCKGGGRMEKHM